MRKEDKLFLLVSTYLCAVLLIMFISAGCKKKGVSTSLQTQSVKQVEERPHKKPGFSVLNMPVVDSEAPILAFYVLNFEPVEIKWDFSYLYQPDTNKLIVEASKRDEKKREHISVILMVWENGKVIWSKDQLNGGSPYFTGEISTDLINNFFHFIGSKGIYNSLLIDSRLVPQEDSITFLKAFKDSNYINLSYEKDPNLTPDTTGIWVSTLPGQGILYQDTNDYKEFLDIVTLVRTASKSLIPDVGQPAGKLSIEFKGTDMKYPD